MVAFVAACAGDASVASVPPPPDRSAFAGLAPVDAALHALTVVAALDSPERGVTHSWRGRTAGVAGEVTVIAEAAAAGGATCRQLSERLVAPRPTPPVVDTPLELVRRLNPELTGRLPPGSRVRLP